jgi:hypothetical protein
MLTSGTSIIWFVLVLVRQYSFCLWCYAVVGEWNLEEFGYGSGTLLGPEGSRLISLDGPPPHGLPLVSGQRG